MLPLMVRQKIRLARYAITLTVTSCAAWAIAVQFYGRLKSTKYSILRATCHISRSKARKQRFYRTIFTLIPGRPTSCWKVSAENLRAAVGLRVAWFNLCRMHNTTKTTPAGHIVTDSDNEFGHLLANCGWNAGGYDAASSTGRGDDHPQNRKRGECDLATG